MTKAVKVNDFKPGVRYCFKRTNPTRGINSLKFEFNKFEFNFKTYPSESDFVNLGDPVVFIGSVEKMVGMLPIPNYLFLLPTGCISLVNKIWLEFQLREKALKIFKSD